MAIFKYKVGLLMQKAIEIIKKYEGFSAKIYLCPAGYKTIGYGHFVNINEVSHFQNGITKLEAENLLLKDMQKTQTAIFRLVKFPINHNQLAALISLTYNIGSGALQRSTLRQKINRGEVEGASAEFLRWVYTGGKKLNGLIKRRGEERDLFLNRTFI